MMKKFYRSPNTIWTILSVLAVGLLAPQMVHAASVLAQIVNILGVCISASLRSSAAQ